VVHGLAYLAPVVHPRIATVTTILDVIWKHHPDATTARYRMVMGTLAPLVGRRAARIIAISEAAKDDISATLGLDPAKFDVAPLGIRPPEARAAPDRDEAARRLGLGPEPVVLCVAAKRAHKNLHGLISALALVPRPRPQLVLPGSPNDYERSLRELAQQKGVEDSVRFPGWVSADDLEDLYGIATCFVLPTFLEGFGLPVLEAMARGVPVACSDIPVLAEVVADAALLFDPRDDAAIAAAISRLLSDGQLRDRLRGAGREQAAQFTWERTARLTLDSYHRAVERA
jgi:glycosyltransferase involved in cell wall biosynthesis